MIETPLDLTDRLAIVTGAGRGIGRAIAETLSRAGASVIACARSADELEDLATTIREASGTCKTVVADLATADGVAHAARSIFEVAGSPDILINNVGGQQPKPFTELQDQDWLDAFALNFLSTVRMTSHIAPQMIERSSGAIVNIASTAAREPLVLSAPYAAAKAAIVNYSKVCADVYAPYGVRVNCVLPGVIETSATSRNAKLSMERTGKTEVEVMRSMLAKHPIPIGRIGRPEDVATVVHLLVSPRSTYITGSTVFVDGGAHRFA